MSKYKNQTGEQGRETARVLMLHALKLAERHGYTNVTRKQIADAAGVSEPLVTHRLGTMNELRRDLVRNAVATRNLRVVAQALSLRDKHAMKAPNELKQAALAALAG